MNDIDVFAKRYFETGSTKDFDCLYRMARREHVLPYLRGKFKLRGDALEEVDQRVWVKVTSHHWSEQGQGFKPWLLRIAHNEAISYLRPGRRIDGEADVSEIGQTPVGRDGPLRRKLLRALLTLPRANRRAFLLKERCGLSYEEIAQREGVSVNRITGRIHLARRRLQKLLGPTWASYIG